YGAFERISGESDGRRFPGNVLAFPTVANTVHPTQKPVELCEYLIKTYTREGQVVADICAGSGTTAIAALNTGRRFIGFENAPAFYGPAAERIQRAREAVARGEKGV
ncbi:MAG: site-specific DNA-methyltransferase, partial [Oscillospiraceae bacterium]|nr:site-specific DNA-methyltransferase [Oscillospiraceae bacterium]